jgi:hypothetical protein
VTDDPLEAVLDGLRRVSALLWSVRRLDRPGPMVVDDLDRPVLAVGSETIRAFSSRLAERGIDCAAVPTSLLGVADDLEELFPDDDHRDERLCLIEAQAEGGVDALLWACMLADRVADREEAAER